MKYATRYGNGTSRGKTWQTPERAPRRKGPISGDGRGNGTAGDGDCTVCGHDMRLVKITWTDTDRGIKRGTPVLPRHTPEGLAPPHKDDPICSGTSLPPVAVKE